MWLFISSSVFFFSAVCLRPLPSPAVSEQHPPADRVLPAELLPGRAQLQQPAGDEGRDRRGVRRRHQADVVGEALLSGAAHLQGSAAQPAPVGSHSRGDGNLWGVSRFDSDS